MFITLQFFLYAYFIFLAVWALIFLVGIYHMFKYGFKSFLSVAATLFFVVVAFLMLLFSFYYISTIDNWDKEIRLLPDFNNDAFNFQNQ